MSLTREDVNIRSDPSIIEGPDRMAYASRPEPRHERLWINGQPPDETRGGNNGQEMSVEGFHDGFDSGTFASAYMPGASDYPQGPPQRANQYYQAHTGMLPPRPGQSYGPSRPQMPPAPLQHDSCGRHGAPSCRAGPPSSCRPNYYQPTTRVPQQYSQYPGCSCNNRHTANQPYWRHCDQQGNVRWT